MYVISLVKIRKNLWLLLRILVVLVLVGLVLPKVVSYVGQWISPKTGWLGSVFSSLAQWFGGGLEKLSLRLDPYVQTLKDYYRAK